jgi:hypothetical protein
LSVLRSKFNPVSETDFPHALMSDIQVLLPAFISKCINSAGQGWGRSRVEIWPLLKCLIEKDYRVTFLAGINEWYQPQRVIK